MPAESRPPVHGQVPAGRPWPLGVEWIEAEDALNFAIYSRHATGVTLLCYEENDPAKAIFEFRFQYPAHKTGSIWHCRLPAADLPGATLYAYRIEGPYDPEQGHRFDPQNPGPTGAATPAADRGLWAKWMCSWEWACTASVTSTQSNLMP